MAHFSIENILSDGVRIYFGPIYGNTYWYHIYVRRNPDPGYPAFEQQGTATIQGISDWGGRDIYYTIGGLEPATDYVVNVDLDHSGWLGAKSFTTAGGQTDRPNTWYWKTPMVSGQPMPNNVVMPAKEWNEFCDVVNAFRLHKGRSSYNFTPAQPGQQPRASQYNEAVNALSSIPSVVQPMPPLATITPGTTIAPHQFTMLSGYTYYIW